MDPFIEIHPPRIFARNHLFQYSTIENEVGNYTNRFSGYSPYMSSQPLLMQHLPEKYGRDAFQHLMAAKPLRLKEITRLLEKYGMEVTPDADCWENIGQWVARQIEENREPVAKTLGFGGGKLPSAEFIFRPLWYSILLDLALLLGEQVIALRSECSWRFWGDIRIKNPGGYGRSPWLLCEVLPKSGKWDHIPERLLPYDTLSRIAASLLADKLQGKTHSFSFGLMFNEYINAYQAKDTLSPGPEDSRVADLLQWLEEYEETNDNSSTEYTLDALNTFLESYIAEHGFLPSASELKRLEEAFGGLPDWVKT